jgi:lipid-A-disaccharide synthase
MTKLLISAGESSGDQRAAALLLALRKQLPELRAFGMGGTALRGAGCRVDVDNSQLDVMGLIEPLFKLPDIFRTMKKLVTLAESEKPDAALLCDYPGFNLRLAARLKARGIRVIYYVSPQVWAWAPGRIKRIAGLVDKMLVLFPFEVELYKQAGLDVEFVGHPLADELPADYPERGRRLRAELGIADDQELLALLPGSRPMELEKHLAVFAAAAARVKAQRPTVQPVIAVTARTDTVSIANAAAKASGLDIPVVAGRSREITAASELALVVSGTATLETALLGRPMLVCYRTKLLNYLIGRLLVTIPCLSLANVIAGRPVVPELWQFEVNPGRVADAALAMLEDDVARARIGAELETLRRKLGVHGASRRAAEAVKHVLERRG